MMRFALVQQISSIATDHELVAIAIVPITVFVDRWIQPDSHNRMYIQCVLLHSESI